MRDIQNPLSREDNHPGEEYHPQQAKIIFLALVIVAVMLTGCTGKSEPTSFFMLTPLTDVPALLPAGSDISVLVGPVTVSAYLDRNQIVGRQAGNEVNIHDFDHWAEPLKENVKRVLITNLSTMLGSAEVYDFESSKSPDTKFQVKVEIYRFDFAREGTVSFEAFWTIYDSRRKMVRRQKTQMTRMASGTDLNSLITAQNILLTDFTIDMAKEIVALADRGMRVGGEKFQFQ